MTRRKQFEVELTHLLNKWSIDNDCNTPDYMLSKYVLGCLDSYKVTRDNLKDWESKK